MKAWLVKEQYEFCSVVVFAETRGKAKNIAKSLELFEDVDFLDIEAHRLPKADKDYRPGVMWLDWADPEDRLYLVKELGFTCADEVSVPDDCAYCSAKRFCYRYKDWEDDAHER